MVAGGQNATLQAQGNRLRAADAAIERLNARAAITDIYRRPVIDAAVTRGPGDRRRRGLLADQVRRDGQPDRQRHRPHRPGPRLRSLGAGAPLPQDDIRFDLASLRARRGSREIALLQPATLTLVKGDLDIRGFSLAAGTGRVDVNGRAGSQLDLQVAVRAVPLSVADIVVPGLGLAGSVDGQAKIGGTAAAPSGDWQIRIARLTTPQTTSAGLPAIDIAANGRLAAGRTSVNGTLNAGRAGTFRLSGSVPVAGAGNLDLTAQGRFDLGIANTVLGASGRRVTGIAVVDARVGGTIADPDIRGTASLSGGSYEDAGRGSASAPSRPASWPMAPRSSWSA